MKDVIEIGTLFHVTEPWSLFAGGIAPIGFNCPGEGCPECARLAAMPAATCTVVAVNRDSGAITMKDNK